MIPYKNLGRDSNVESYDIQFDLIKVKFKRTSRIYTYSNLNATKIHVDKLKEMASRGHGLNSYIYKYVRNKYDK